ncbi:MAG: hypothetical protein JWQ09_4185 [Segetibacter sp.]|nr:hypothetical protein [Segetibacter sp.]
MIQLKKSQPDIILSTIVGSFTRYVFSAPFGADNKRHPSLTDDPEKAQRFFTEVGAKECAARFPKDGKKYTPELFAPAAAKN